MTLALVHRAQTGDAEAFGALYDRYVDLVYRYVYARVRSAQVAEDLTSETFLRALRRITSFSWQGRDVGAWFVTIARNLVADHYKSSRYRLETTTDDVTTSAPAGALAEAGLEDAVLDAMRDEALLDAVRQLGPEQQECIVLRFLEGMSVAETARVMGKNDGAVKALQHRAVRELGGRPGAVGGARGVCGAVRGPGGGVEQAGELGGGAAAAGPGGAARERAHGVLLPALAARPGAAVARTNEADPCGGTGWASGRLGPTGRALIV